MRCAMVTGDFYPDSTGGVQRVVYHLARGLVEIGHHVTVITRQLSGDMPCCEEVEGIHVIRFASKTDNMAKFHVSEFLSSRRAFKRVLNQKRPDIVHIHEPLPGLGAASALTGTDIPTIYTFHGQWSVQWLDARLHGSRSGGLAARWFARYLRGIERLAMRRSVRLVALSRFMARTAVDLYSIAPQRITTIPNGVDLGRFRPVAQLEARRNVGLPEGKPVLGFAGRLSGEKGVSMLLQAVALLRREMPEAILLVAGEGPERAALEEQARSLGVDDLVRFMGHVDDMASFYNALDLLIVPSVREPFGLVTLEALACGTPVIGGPVGGTAEILRRFDERLVFADMTPRAIADKVCEVASTLSPRLRVACRAFVEATFSWDRMVDAYEAVYMECVGT
ncbi:MAG: glycosyltransferase family 4 protein [Planctomycetota bacterium]